MDSKQKASLIELLDFTEGMVQLYESPDYFEEDFGCSVLVERLLKVGGVFINDKVAQKVIKLFTEIIEESMRISKIEDENDQVDEFKQVFGALLTKPQWIEKEIEEA